MKAVAPSEVTGRSERRPGMGSHYSPRASPAAGARRAGRTEDGLLPKEARALCHAPPLGDDAGTQTLKDGRPHRQSEPPAGPSAEAERRQGAEDALCQHCGWGHHVPRWGSGRGRTTWKRNAARLCSGKSEIPVDVSSSVWSPKRSRARRAGGNTDATLFGAALRARPGDTVNRREGSGANAPPQTRGGGRTNE